MTDIATRDEYRARRRYLSVPEEVLRAPDEEYQRVSDALVKAGYPALPVRAHPVPPMDMRGLRRAFGIMALAGVVAWAVWVNT
jgi:hypothetical protein